MTCMARPCPSVRVQGVRAVREGRAETWVMVRVPTWDLQRRARFRVWDDSAAHTLGHRGGLDSAVGCI